MKNDFTARGDLDQIFWAAGGLSSLPPTRAGNRLFWWLSALRAHTKTPHESELLGKTLLKAAQPPRADPDRSVATWAR